LGVIGDFILWSTAGLAVALVDFYFRGLKN
jgi:hypothetical protein